MAATTVSCVLKSCAIAVLLPMGIGSFVASIPNAAYAEDGLDKAKNGRKRNDRKGGRSTSRVRNDDVSDDVIVGSGFLDSSGGGVVGRGLDVDADRSRRAQDRRDARRERAAARNANLIAYQVAQADVSHSRDEALRLYAIYERLNAMSMDEQRQVYPNGDHAAVLRDAAIRYNNAVSSFQIAEETAALTLSSLTGGQSLNESVLGELNALLGQ